jgi:hypothetical protein
MLFEQKVSARKFAETKVDPFRHGIGEGRENEKLEKAFME